MAFETIYSLPLLLAAATLAVGIVTMNLFNRKSHFPIEGRTAIVTGGSQGFGLSVAKRLASKGANVVIIAQDIRKLEAAVEEIKSSASSQSQQRFSHLSFDLRDPASGPAILDTVTKWNHDVVPSIIFCCAGHCLPGFFASSSIETLRGQMDTVYWSAAYMAHAALNHWLKTPSSKNPLPSSPNNANSNSRHIIFTSSALAFFPVAGYAPYSPAKAAMKSLADTLNQELAMYNGAQGATTNSPPPADIKVHTIYPMGILSPGFDHEQTLKPALTKLLEKDDKPQSPDEVARIAIERLEQGEQLITTMLIGHLLKGVGMGSSVRHGFVDLFWNLAGSVVILFVGPDIVRQCGKWGREKGIERK